MLNGKEYSHEDDGFVDRVLPFIKTKPQEEWTAEERQQFNDVMNYLIDGWSHAVHREIMSLREADND